MEGNLKENGWFLSTEGIAECEKACSKERPTTTEFLKAATNLDLRQFGDKHLPEELNKGKVESIKGPVVLQIQKLRNISAPKANEESTHAPRLLKLQLTDGQISCQGLESATISDLSLGSPPGTKICLIGTVPVQNGILMLDSGNTKVLGGEVEKLVTKWKLQKTLAKHSRTTPSGEEGPPPFVSFRQLKGGNDGRGRGAPDKPKVNSAIPNGIEKNHDNNNAPNRYQDKGYRQSHQDSGNRRDRQNMNNSGREERFDTRGDTRGHPGGRDSYRGNTRMGSNMNTNRNDSRGGDFRNDSRDNRRPDKPPGRTQYEDQQNQRDGRERDWRGSKNLDSQVVEQDGPEDSKHTSDSDDKGMSRRFDQGRHERGERGHPEMSGRGGGRGSMRGGRGGRRDGIGRGRSDSTERDEQDEYRARQPSDGGTLWDYLEKKLPINKSTSKSTPPAITTTTTTAVTTTQQAPKVAANPTEQNANDADKTKIMPRQESSDGEPPGQSKQTQEPPRRIKTETSGSSTPPRELKNRDGDRGKGERGGLHMEPSQHPYQPYRDGKQQGPRQYQQRQQNIGPGKNRGGRGRHEDGRSHNQSLPPRLQKKQQQQYQQYHYNRDRTSSGEKELHRDKTSSPSSGSGGEGRSSQSPSVHSGDSGKDDSPPHAGQQRQQGRKPKGYQRPHQQQEEYRTSGEQKQVTVAQYEPQPTHTYMPTQAQPVYLEQTRPYEMHPMREQPEPGTLMQQEYHYQHRTPPAPGLHPQQYQMYQLQPQMPGVAPPPGAIPTHQPITAPQQQQVPTQMAAAPIRWKKGDQCLALRRDGQFYSAKIEDITPDGSQCMVSFQDFHGGCEMVMVASLRPFPIIAWTDANNAPQSHPVTTITAVPVYAQPTPVAMMARPQVMVQVPNQPHYNVGPRVAAQAPQPPPGVQWQPAQMNYPDMRAQAYQPMVHYDPMPQTSNPAARPAFIAVPPGGAVQFVRGVKELHGQELYAHPGGLPDGSDPSKHIPTTTVYYNKANKPNRPTQTFYVPPRQPKYREQNN